MSAPSPLHRHQSSLSGAIDFSAEAPLGTNQRSNARRKIYRIVERFGADSAIDNGVPPLLARDGFLRALFQAGALSLAGRGGDSGNDGGLDDLEDLRSLLFGFAGYFVDNFFLPSYPSFGGPVLSAIVIAVLLPANLTTRGADRRIVQNGDDGGDDDGALLLKDTVIDELEVAHILPHSLMKADADCELVYLL
ncbi:hypothetical protein GGS24DRAFT_502421 [Hypoxylon argillaceum]|nr:hypothetical protein GGS24DRAFT_502421 [Hypoxylon argillaceum]